MAPHEQFSKSRDEKLRSSCDSCHLSKVKCSKTRPLCSRCLICGTDCTYSPSARVGRKAKSKGKTSAKGNQTPNYRIEHTGRPVHEASHQFQTDTSVSYPAVPYSCDQMAVHDFNQGLSCSPTTPSTSGYISPVSPDEIDPILLLDSQTIFEPWMHNPGAHQYFPWESDALYSSLPSLSPPDMMMSEPTNPWSNWHDIDPVQVSYIDPGTFQYVSNMSTGDPQYSVPSPAGA